MQGAVNSWGEFMCQRRVQMHPGSSVVRGSTGGIMRAIWVFLAQACRAWQALNENSQKRPLGVTSPRT